MNCFTKKPTYKQILLLLFQNGSQCQYKSLKADQAQMLNLLHFMDLIYWTRILLPLCPSPNPPVIQQKAIPQNN